MSLPASIRPKAPATVAVGPGETTLAQWQVGTRPALFHVVNQDAVQELRCTVYRRADVALAFARATTPLDLQAVAPLGHGTWSFDVDGSIEYLVTGQSSGAGLDAVVAVREPMR